MNEQNGKIPAIGVEGVTKRFGSVMALDDVSFTVQPGELFFLLGPSGCGKTTMLRIFAGLETMDQGRVLFNGKDTAKLPPHERNAPMVFQNYALWPHLKVKDNIAFGLVERKVPRVEIDRRVRETLDRVDLGGLGERTPGQLSGGQQQRVVLARALILNPSIMLLDEPLSNLDTKLRTEMREELEALHRDSPITFVYVTHDQVEALSLADRLAVLEDGRIRAVGKPWDLYHRPPNVFCADFLGEANLVSASIEGSDGDRVMITTSAGTWQAVPAGNGPPAKRAKVHCLVRPENLRRGEEGTGGNRFEAEIKILRFNGPTVTVVLDAGGVQMRSTLLNHQAAGLEVGTRSTWMVMPEHTVVIPGDEAGEDKGRHHDTA